MYLTIDLVEAMGQRGFIKAPFEHIIRRRWQKPINISSFKDATATTNNYNDKNASNINKIDINDQPQHILSSHIRFVLKWFYMEDRNIFIKTLKDEDTLHVLSIAILFELESLVQNCLERYINKLLSINTINRDLEIICQLPRHHPSYHQLRDAALLLLLRYGSDHPQIISRLPVDYMSDILNADLLFVGCEYERYCLLREVLVAFMHSVGKITWTTAGPVDQNSKRLSGFLRKPLKALSIIQSQNNINETINNNKSNHVLLSPSVVRQSSKKRKRIPSEELADQVDNNSNNSNNNKSSSNGDSDEGGLITSSTNLHPRKISRISFSARIPFEKLVADASSGGVIDKATIISYLLRTTVIYSNMTFDQLSIVRQDGIVDESIVFRALWQREALERLLFPFNFQQSQYQKASPSSLASQLIDTPPTSSSLLSFNASNKAIAKKSSATIIPRYGKMDTVIGHDYTPENSQHIGKERQAALDEYFDVDDANHHERRRRILLGVPKYRFCTSVQLKSPLHDDDGWQCMNITNDKKQHQTINKNDNENKKDQSSTSTSTTTTTTTTTQYQKIYNKNIYSESEYILGHWYRVRVEVQVLPKSLLIAQEDIYPTKNKSEEINDEDEESMTNDDSSNDIQVISCRFELQRDGYVGQEDSSLKTHSNQTLQNDSVIYNIQEEVEEDISEEGDDEDDNNDGGNNKEKNEATVVDAVCDNDNDNALTTENIVNDNDTKKDKSSKQQRQSKIRYSIYCLNRHEAVVSHDYIDPEDRVLIPVSEVTESKDSSSSSIGYVGQIVLDEKFKQHESNIIDIDMIVVLEVFGINKV
ncbi:unnamed protein product [Cunninghamella blakesleeana]